MQNRSGLVLFLHLPFIFYALCLPALKNSFVSLATTPLKANMAIILGIAIRPLKISAIVHTALTVIYGPINTARI